MCQLAYIKMQRSFSALACVKSYVRQKHNGKKVKCSWESCWSIKDSEPRTSSPLNTFWAVPVVAFHQLGTMSSWPNITETCHSVGNERPLQPQGDEHHRYRTAIPERMALILTLYIAADATERMNSLMSGCSTICMHWATAAYSSSMLMKKQAREEACNLGGENENGSLSPLGSSTLGVMDHHLQIDFHPHCWELWPTIYVL